MPAISAIQGFVLGGESGPSLGAHWDVKHDRQHSTSGWLMPRSPSSTMTKASSSMARMSTASPNVHRYTSVADLARVPRRDPSAATRPPWLPPLPPTAPQFARPATPSGAVRLLSVTKQPNTPTPLAVRRAAETQGQVSYEGSAGYASSLLMQSRLNSSSQPNFRKGRIFADGCGIY